MLTKHSFEYHIFSIIEKRLTSLNRLHGESTEKESGGGTKVQHSLAQEMSAEQISSSSRQGNVFFLLIDGLGVMDILVWM